MSIFKKLYYKIKFRKNKYKYLVKIYDVITKDIISIRHNVPYNDVVYYLDILFTDTGLYIERER